MEEHVPVAVQGIQFADPSERVAMVAGEFEVYQKRYEAAHDRRACRPAAQCSVTSLHCFLTIVGRCRSCFRLSIQIIRLHSLAWGRGNPRYRSALAQRFTTNEIPLNVLSLGRP